jgi:tetratricopeptide (TPR) repeat protein
MYRPIALADFGKALTDIGQALSLVQILATGRVPVVRAILDGKLGVPPLEWWLFADISDVPRSAVTFRLRDGRVIRATAIDLDIEAADLPLTHYARGQVLRVQGRLDEAVVEYEAALALNPNMVRALADIGRGDSAPAAGDPPQPP